MVTIGVSNSYKLLVDRSVVMCLQRNLIDKISYRLAGVFSVKSTNSQIAQKFVEKGFITNNEKANELDPFEDRGVWQWAQKLLSLIRSRGEQTILDCLATLCDPNETGSRDYSNKVHGILETVQGVTVMIMPRYLRIKRDLAQPLSTKAKILVLVGIAISAVLFSAWFGKEYFSTNQPPSFSTFYPSTTLPPPSHSPSPSTTDVEDKTDIMSRTDSAVTEITSSAFFPISSNEPRTSRKPKSTTSAPPFEMHITSCASYYSFLFQICDPRVKSQAIFAIFDPHTFKNCHLDCAQRLHSATFFKANLGLLEISKITSVATNLKYLSFNGYQPCLRSKNSDLSFIAYPQTRLSNLDVLVFQNLWGRNIDCTSLFAWVASDKVRGLSPSTVTFSNVTFTEKNMPDITHILAEVYRGLRVLYFNGVSFETEMFNDSGSVVMPAETNVTHVLFNVQDPTSLVAGDSVFNYVTKFLSTAAGTCVTAFTSNVYFSPSQFLHLLTSFSRLKTRSLKIKVLDDDEQRKEEISLRLLHVIPDLEELDLEIFFKNREGQVWTVKLTDSEHLSSTLTRLAVVSNQPILTQGGLGERCLNAENPNSDGSGSLYKITLNLDSTGCNRK